MTPTSWVGKMSNNKSEVPGTEKKAKKLITKDLPKAQYGKSCTDCTTRMPETSVFMVPEGSGPLHGISLLGKVTWNSLLTATQPS